jgi:uncharacterized protein (DUF849 family)
MLLKAAINGRRGLSEHPAIPIFLEQQAKQAAMAVAAGAGAIHVHPRNSAGQESLAPQDIANALNASRLDEIEAALQDITGRRLLHGFETSTWEFIALASRRGYDARIGFEDTLALPDGSRAEDNGQLVAAAQQVIARHLSANSLCGHD